MWNVAVKIIISCKYTAQAMKTNLKHKIENIELLTTFFYFILLLVLSVLISIYIKLRNEKARLK